MKVLSEPELIEIEHLSAQLVRMVANSETLSYFAEKLDDNVRTLVGAYRVFAPVPKIPPMPAKRRRKR